MQLNILRFYTLLIPILLYNIFAFYYMHRNQYWAFCFKSNYSPPRKASRRRSSLCAVKAETRKSFCNTSEVRATKSSPATPCPNCVICVFFPFGPVRATPNGVQAPCRPRAGPVQARAGPLILRAGQPYAYLFSLGITVMRRAGFPPK